MNARINQLKAPDYQSEIKRLKEAAELERLLEYVFADKPQILKFIQNGGVYPDEPHPQLIQKKINKPELNIENLKQNAKYTFYSIRDQVRNDYDFRLYWRKKFFF